MKNDLTHSMGARPICRERFWEWPFWVGLALSCLGGCAVGPDYEPPDAEMPDAWHQELTEGLAQGEADLETWWTALNDPVLDGLIERAREGNLDLRGALARIEEARARLGISRGEFLPGVDATGTYLRSRFSEDTVPVVPGGSRTDDFYQAGLDASWEIDIFGRVRRSVEAAGASYQAAVEGYRDVLVILFAEVASNYVDVRTLQARVRFAEENVERQRATLQLTRDRFQAQLAPELDVRQAELNLGSTEALIPSLRILLMQAVHRLGVLLGEHPHVLYELLSAEGEIPSPPEEVVVGLPTDLLRQRPDIRGAERALAAQTARIGVATADLYPRFSLTGTFAFEALDAGDLFESGSRAFSFGPSVRWNVFAGGRIRNNIRVEDALTEQALVAYEQILLLALEEVENSMVAFVQEKARTAALERSVTAARSSVELVQTLYRTGLTDFQNVLDSERSLFLQEDELAASEGNVSRDLIRIYKAMGGGWRVEPEQPNDARIDID